MQPHLQYLLNISFIGLIVILIYKYIYPPQKKVVRFLLILIFLILCYLFLNILFHTDTNSDLITKSINDDIEIVWVAILYSFMLAGMIAHQLYITIEEKINKKNKKKKYDICLIIAPVLTSPIIFIPLLATLQNANIDFENITTAKLMLFLIAFENGFFWKEHFDNRMEPKRK